jgi:hypothetical protein
METSLTYETLDSSSAEIRLLKVRYSNDGGIECDLTKCSLNENLEYYALSYVWGDPTVTKNILVNGKVFAATINLVAALETFSVESDNSNLLWMDAICINQTDVKERNTQVQMMGSIFKKPSWLWPGWG